MSTDFRTLLEALVVGHVRFVVIGGLALVLRGGSRITVDVDVCYARDRQNLELLGGTTDRKTSSLASRGVSRKPLDLVRFQARATRILGAY